MARSLTLAIQILGDARDAQQAFDQTSGSAKNVEKSLGSLALPAGIALGAVTLLGKGAADAAAEAEQSFGALESVFGDNAEAAKELARASATSVGLATADYAQMSAVLASQLRNMGVAEEQLLPTTESLIKQGADMAAMFGGTTADAVNAISSLLRGERDPIERYGVSIKESTLEAEIGADRLKKMSDEQAVAAKTAATMAILTRQTAAAQGQFAREADTASGAQQRSTAAWENAQAALGEGLLPVMVIFAGVLATVSGFVQDNTTAVLILGGVVAGLAAAILLANAAIKAYQLAVAAWTVVTTIAKGASAAWTAVQWALNAALAANPIGLVVLAIAALVAGLVLAYQNSETFRRIVDAAFRAVGEVVGVVVDFVVGAIRTMLDIATAVFATLESVFGGPFRLLARIATAVFRIVAGLVKVGVHVITSTFVAVGKVLAGPFEAWLFVVQRVFAIVGQIVGAFLSAVRDVFGKVRGIIESIVEFIGRIFGKAGDTMAGPFEALVGIVRNVFATIRGIVSGAVDFITGLLEGIAGALEGVADFVESLPGGKAATAPAAAARGLLGAPMATASVAPSVQRTRLSGQLTITHRIDDPHGALARVPGGAAAVAGMLNRGVEGSGLYRSLQHAAGVR